MQMVTDLELNDSKGRFKMVFDIVLGKGGQLNLYTDGLIQCHASFDGGLHREDENGHSLECRALLVDVDGAHAGKLLFTMPHDRHPGRVEVSLHLASGRRLFHAHCGRDHMEVQTIDPQYC